MTRQVAIAAMIGVMAGMVWLRVPVWLDAAPVSTLRGERVLSTESEWGRQAEWSLMAIQSAKVVRTAIRRVFNHILWSGRTWVRWVRAACPFVLIVLVAPLCEPGLLATWREQGFAAFRAAVALTVAVYVRLLADGRSPVLGKILLVLALAYGIKRSDLIPDGWIRIGLIDDVIIVGVASRVFMWLCPTRLVEEHARKATRGRARNLRERRHAGAALWRV
jgi:uncharacterized membrane protein YkvA (DUF1232 family)